MIQVCEGVIHSPPLAVIGLLPGAMIKADLSGLSRALNKLGFCVKEDGCFLAVRRFGGQDSIHVSRGLLKLSESEVIELLQQSGLVIYS